MKTEEPKKGEERYCVLVKEKTGWVHAHLRLKPEWAFIDVEDIIAQDHLFSAGRGTTAIVVRESDYDKGLIRPMKPTKALAEKIKELRDVKAAGKLAPLVPAKEVQEAPKPEEKPVVAEQGDGIPQLSAAALAWLKLK